MDGYDKQLIGELLARAAYALDHEDNLMLRSCFSDDAVFSLEIGDDSLSEFEGIDAIMGLFKATQEAQTNVRRHAITNVWYREARHNAATVVSYMTLCATEGDRTEVLTTGVYTDEVVKAGIDGGWQIQRRSLVLDKSL